MRRLALFASLLLVGCSRPDPDAPFRLRIAVVGPLAPLSSDIEFGYGVIVQWLVFEPLLHPEGTKWRARVVEGWEPDGPRRYRFQLRPGVTFSDGSPVTAADIGAALGTEAAVESTDAGLTATWRDPGTSAQGLLLSTVVSRQSGGHQLGTGPFAIAEQDASHILLKRRRPTSRLVGEVELTSFPTARDAFAATLRAEVNMLLMPDDGQLELLEGVDRLRVIRGHGIHSVSVLFNPVALTREERVALVGLVSQPAVSATYGALCLPDGPPRDAPVSLPAGPPIDVLVNSDPSGLMRVALALRRALGARGGQISVVSPVEGLERMASGRFTLMLGTLQAWPDDFVAAGWLTGAPRNLTGYSNPGVDAALRRSDFAEARQQLAADPPFVPLCRLERTAVVDARLTDATLGAYDMLDTLPAWQVAR